MFLVARWQSYFGRNVSMAVLMIKGTPGVMMWVLNVVAISKPPKSDRWLSLVFGGLFCCIRKSFIFICNKEFCTCLYVCMPRESIKHHHLFTSVHSGGLAERLNRLQRRQRSAVSFWKHQSLSDTSTATGDPHKPTKSSTVTLRILLTFTSQSSQFTFNVELWFAGL